MGKEILMRFGLDFERGGTHSARTMMLEDLQLLIASVQDGSATKESYIQSIEIDNCLGKRSGRTRKITARHLVELYSLDPNVALFRNLLFFWQRDQVGQPLLALLSAFVRDSTLRLSAPFILSAEQGAVITTKSMSEFIEQQQLGRFSVATLKSTSQNLNSTWTKSGHLTGRVKKIRTRAKATAGSTAYALLLGYLNDIRGEALFESQYAKLLDCPIDRAVELAEEASRRGWIVLKRLGIVIEVSFPQLLTDQEMEWIREQNQTSHQFIQ